MKKITLLFLFIITTASAQTLDQIQLNYNAGTSARTLAGYSIFQSFTSGLTGTLVKIDMGVFNFINGAGTLNIYSGSNNLGTLLQSLPVTVYCASGNCFASFTTSVSVTAGQVYTFHFTPGAGIPDPYGVQVQVPGTYSGGQFGLIDPSGTYYPGFDLVFRTYVNTSLGIVSIDYDSASIYPNPLTTATTLELQEPLSNASATLFTIYGQVAKQWNGLSGNKILFDCDGLSNGLYLLEVSQNDTVVINKKLVISN